jgi:hypothetical protein
LRPNLQFGHALPRRFLEIQPSLIAFQGEGGRWPHCGFVLTSAKYTIALSDENSGYFYSSCCHDCQHCHWKTFPACAAKNGEIYEIDATYFLLMTLSGWTAHLETLNQPRRREAQEHQLLHQKAMILTPRYRTDQKSPVQSTVSDAS